MNTSSELQVENRFHEEPTTVFRRVDFNLYSLLTYLEVGDIGLPDLQRPFVWKPTQVRDLFDSMYHGFPVGYLIFWENVEQSGTKQIGVGERVHTVPKLLVIDGQQRLTSLFSVFRGRPIVDSKFREKRIEIAFCPSSEKFEVTNAVIRRDPEYISDISSLWCAKKPSRKVINEFISKLREKRPLSEEEEDRISGNIDRLFDLQKYPFTALEISSTVDEEQVSSIFVRINSGGIKLGQANFILTLMSVYWDEGRYRFEQFARDAKNPPKTGSGSSAYNHFIQPSPEQLLRAAIAVGFYRGRLRSAYQVLRGKDPETETYSPEKRDQQFARLKEAQDVVLNLTHWHQFFSCVTGAGFRSGSLISSENTLMYAYALYLIGKTRYSVQDHDLDLLIGRWMYSSTLSERYTASPESAVEGDLNRIRNLDDPEAFVRTLDKIINDTLTSDFWSITLPNNLDSSAASSPWLSAYLAAQNKLVAPVLFSHKLVSDVLDPTVRPKKKTVDKHHLFPRGWLASQGIKERTSVNQIANFALLEWPDNIRIKDAPPREYLPRMADRFDQTEWGRMFDLHALPKGWENMSYDEFLRERRILMAKLIKRGYETLSKPSP